MKILVGVDGSEASEKAVEWCAQYAPKLGAEVVVVHAIDIPVYAAPGVGYLPLPALSDDDRAQLTDTVRTVWCAALSSAGVKYRVEIVDGPPATVLIQAARAEDAALVVTGRRGRGGFAELLLGSTSHQLSHHLERPLVIVPD
ncbi:MAG TPA: universal stress protein [Acidimicrobiia bacterium]|nr:universal stress protein [Acidimicrobiia bacterium]